LAGFEYLIASLDLLVQAVQDVGLLLEQMDAV
jgi:hypothetical protein